MKKSLLYRLFRLGAMPMRVRTELENEGIVVADEGMPGRFITRHVNAPGKRYRFRSEGFSGWLAVTNRRVICSTFSKRQINIAVDDPKIGEIHVDVPKQDTLSLSFESSAFREGWQGAIELRFRTDLATEFDAALRSAGASAGRLGIQPAS
jgi:hypothetical protein